MTSETLTARAPRALAASMAALFGITGNAASAATAFQDPASASWGGWNRGDAGTVFQAWSMIEDEDGTAPFVFDDTPDAGSFGPSGGTNRLEEVTGGAFVTGGGLGGNVYSFSVATDWEMDIAGFGPTGLPARVAVQTNTVGIELDYASMRLNGVAPDSITTLFTGSAGGAFGGTVAETLFLWTLPEGQENYEFTFNAAGSSMSLDEISVDVAPVPLPAPVALLGSALAGLFGLTRRRGSVTA